MPELPPLRPLPPPNSRTQPGVTPLPQFPRPEAPTANPAAGSSATPPSTPHAPTPPTVTRPGPDGHPAELARYLDAARNTVARWHPREGFPMPTQTYKELATRTFVELRTGARLGPKLPAGVREMDRAQSAAAQMFKANLNAADPHGSLRQRGEFIQAYSVRGEYMQAASPMKYGPVTSLEKMPVVDGATHVIHTRPAAGDTLDFPTSLDFLMAHKRSQGSTNTVSSHMLYDQRADKFYGYEGKVHPETRKPEFHELVVPFDMGPPLQGRQSIRSLPDAATWGHHFIHWDAGPGPDP